LPLPVCRRAAAAGRPSRARQHRSHRGERVAGYPAGPDELPQSLFELLGINVGELAEDGRLRRITGFFGELSVEQNA